MCFIFQKNTFSLKEEMGFNDDEMKSLLLREPKLWMKSKSLTLISVRKNACKITVNKKGFITEHNIVIFLPAKAG
jgi:hypothetical protein